MPVTQNRHEATQIAITAPPPSNNLNPRPSIKIQDLGVGCIVWLPSKENDNVQSIKCIRDSCCSKQELQDGGYNHPVVILKVSPTYFGDTVCSIAQVTSKKRSRFNRVRISQEQPTLRPYGGNDCETELYLENGTMNKQSYVVLEHVFQVLGTRLRTCSFRSGSRAYDSRLCEQSYALLMAKLDFEPADWVNTIDLKFGVVRSREALSRRQSTAQSRTLGNSYHITSTHLARQSSRAHRLETGTNPVFSSPHLYSDQSPLLANSASRGVCIHNQLVEIRITKHIEDMEGLSKVDMFLLQETEVMQSKVFSRGSLCYWLWDHLSGGFIRSNKRRQHIISKGTALHYKHLFSLGNSQGNSSAFYS